MMQREMSLRRRFLLILIACVVLPLVIVSMVAYRGLMTYDMTMQKHLTRTNVLLDRTSEKTLEAQKELSIMEENLRNLSQQTRRMLIFSSVLSIIIIVAVGAFLAKNIAAEMDSASKAVETDHTAATDLSDQLEEMRKKLGNLIDDKDPDDD